MTKYKVALMGIAHKHKLELDILDQGRNYFRVRDGLDPMPEWIVNLAKSFKKEPLVVFDELLKYCSSMAYTVNKKHYQ